MLNKNTVQTFATLAVSVFGLGLLSFFDLLQAEHVIALIPMITGIVLIEWVLGQKNKKYTKKYKFLYQENYDSISIWDKMQVETNLMFDEAKFQQEVEAKINLNSSIASDNKEFGNTKSNQIGTKLNLQSLLAEVKKDQNQENSVNQNIGQRFFEVSIAEETKSTLKEQIQKANPVFFETNQKTKTNFFEEEIKQKDVNQFKTELELQLIKNNNKFGQRVSFFGADDSEIKEALEQFKIKQNEIKIEENQNEQDSIQNYFAYNHRLVQKAEFVNQYFARNKAKESKQKNLQQIQNIQTNSKILEQQKTQTSQNNNKVIEKSVEQIIEKKFTQTNQTITENVEKVSRENDSQNVRSLELYNEKTTKIETKKEQKEDKRNYRFDFRWNFLRPQIIAGIIIFCSFLALVFNLKVEAIATPKLNLNIPTQSRIGENWTFTAEFSNSGNTVGYGPYIDVILPTSGIDGSTTAPFDGIDFVNATYLNTPTINTVLIFPSSVTGTNPCTTSGEFPVNHPLAKGTNGLPLVVCGKPNNKLVVAQLPFGSFTPGQPNAPVTFTVTSSNLSDVGTNMDIKAQAGFYLGNDSFQNPATDPSLLSSVITNANAPSLFDVFKTYNGPESETATGPNFVRSYTISADVATGQTLSNFQLTDVLPNNMVVTGIVNSSAPITTNITTFPYGPVNSGQLTANFTSPVIGTSGTNDASFTFSYYIPDKDANNQSIINPTTGAFVTSLDKATGNGNWKPIDTRDGTLIAVNSQGTTSSQHILTDKSIATQKSVANITDTRNSPGDTLEYTINFQVSDYFSFDSLKQSDTFSDGQRLDTTFAPTLSVTDRSGTKTGSFTLGTNALVDTSKIANTPSNIDSSTDGSTTVSFDISQLMITLGDDGAMQGGRSITPNSVGAVGTIKFRTKIQQNYSDAYSTITNDQAVSLNDILTNTTIISGRVLDNATLAPTGSTRTDNSGTNIRILAGNLTKSVYSINGDTNYTSPATISANDIITYRLQYNIPQTDVENFKITDYLPLPVFPVGALNLTIDPTVSNVVPPANSIKFGPNYTFSPTGLVTPIVTRNVGENSVTFDFGTQDDPLDRPSVIDLFLSVKVGPDPIGDGVFITNQARSVLGSTNQVAETADAIVQIKLTQPEIKITKGIIGKDNPTATFVPTTTGPVTFTQPPTTNCPVFSGTINSTNLATSPINSDLKDSDAGDKVRYAIAIENTGTGANGAFDLKVQDSLPSDLINPTNLCVTLGDGTVLSPTTGYIQNGGGLFGPTGNLEIVDPSVTQGGLSKMSPTNGKNIVIISYEATIGGGVVPNRSIINTAKVTNYSSQPDGPNYALANPSDDSQTVNIATPKITKTILSTNQVSTLNNNVVVGEKVRYRLSIKVPEGKTPSLKIVDTLDAGLSFVDCIAITNNFTADISNDLSGGFNSACNDPINPTVTNTGKTVTFDLGSVTNTNNNNTQDETIFVDYDVVVDNSSGNTNGKLLNNTVDLTWIDSTKTDQSANKVSGNAPDVTVKEPKLKVTKTANPTTGDAGDQITYTIVLTHDTTSNATAFDADLSDVLSTKLSFASGTLASTGFTPTSLVENSGTINAKFDSFPVGSTTTITFKANVLVTVQASEVIANASPVKWTSLPTSILSPLSPYNTATTERTGNITDPGTTLNNYSTTSNANFTVSGLTPTKSLVSTSEVLTTGSNLTIGEIARYRLAISIPEGTTSGIRLVDNLPSGLIYLNDGTTKVSIVADTPSNITNQLDLASSCLVTGSNSNISPDNTCTLDTSRITGSPFNSGVDPIFSLGNFVNNENDSNGEFLVIEFNAIVTNEAVNQAYNNATGVATLNTRSNTVSAYVNTSTLIGTSTATVVTIVEPVIRNLNKTITTTPTNGGDNLDYTITFSNTGNAPAFNVKIADLLNTNLDLINPTTTGIVITKPTGTTTTNNSTITNVDLEFDQLLPGESITIVIKTKVKDIVPAGAIISDTANLTYTSLPQNGTAINPTLSISGTAGGITGERTGTTGVNDYTGTSTTTTTLSKPTIDKKAPTLTTYTIGDKPDFDILVTLPEGTTKSLVIKDTLPSGLSYVSHQVLTTDPTLATTFSGTLSTPTVTNASGVYSFDFGDTVVPATSGVNGSSFIIRIKTKVNNILSNQRNATLTNIGNLQFLNGATTETVNDSTPATITVKEPILDLNKTITSSNPNPDAGDEVEYTVTIKHNANSGATAYNASWTDILPTGLSNATCISLIATGTGSPALTCSNFASSGSNLNLGSFDLPITSNITLKYKAIIDNNISYNQTLTNNNQITWTTQSGTNPDARTGNDGILNTVNILNDYKVNSQASIVVTNQASITKALITTDLAKTTGNNLTIGETANYQLAVTLPEGLSTNVKVSDVIPTGLAYVPNSLTIDSSGFNGVINTPTVSGNLDINFANLLVNGDNITTNNSFKINLQLKVTDIITNSGLLPATTHTNTVTLTTNNNPAVSSNPVVTTVVEPNLTLTKDIPQNTASTGDTITVNLTVKNTGTSEAFDVVIEDPIPTAKLSNITNTTTQMNGFSFGLSPIGSNTIVKFSGGNVPVGSTYNFSFTAKITSGVTYAELINNVASISEYSTMPNVVTGERIKPIITANDNLTITSPDLVITKTDNQTLLSPNQNTTYNLNIQNIGDAIATGVVVTETVPNSSTFDSVNSTVGWSCSNGSVAGTICTYTIPSLNFGTANQVNLNFAIKVNSEIASGVSEITNTAIVKDDGTHGVEILTTNNTAKDIDTLVAEPTLTLTKTDNKTTVLTGDTLTYEMVITNTGNKEATGVVLTDTLPDEVTFVSATNGGTLSGNVVTWPTITSLPANLSVVRKVTVQVKNPLTTNNNTIKNTAKVVDNGANTTLPIIAVAEDTDNITASPILTLTKTDNDTQSSPNGIVVYELKLGNTGNQIATGVVITETVPNSTTFDSANSTTGWSCSNGSVAGTICTFNQGNLSVNQTQSVFFAVKVKGDIASTITQIVNTASIKDDKNNTVSSTDNTPIKYVDLKVTKTDNDAMVTGANQILVYNIDYFNLGETGATGVVITETVPNSTTFDSANSTTGWSCSNGSVAGTICTFNQNAVGSGAGGTINFAVKLNSDILDGDTISNTVKIADDGTKGSDINLDNNTASEQTPIITSGKITGQIYLDNDQNGIQDNTEPNGNLPSGTIVQITDINNPNVSFNSILDSNGNYNQNVPAGTYSVVVISPQNWLISNSQQLGDGIGANPTIVIVQPNTTKTAGKDGLYQQPISSSSSSSSISSTSSVSSMISSLISSLSSQLSSVSSSLSSLVTGVDLKVTKTDNGFVASPNGIISYQVSYSNIGSINLTGVKINEIVPANSTFDVTNSTVGWDCPLGGISGSPCTFTVGSLNSGQGGNIVFAVKVKANVTNTTVISNFIGITDDGTHGIDINQGNNNATETTPVSTSISSSSSLSSDLSSAQSSVSSTVSSQDSSQISSLVLSQNSSVSSSPSSTSSSQSSIDPTWTNTLTGSVYLDPNQSGTQETTGANIEPNGNLPTGVIVKIVNLNNPSQTWFPTINPDGTYSQALPTGVYAVITTSPSGWIVTNSTELGDGTGANPTVVSLATNQTKTAGKDGLYQTPNSSSSSLSSIVSSQNSSLISSQNSSQNSSTNSSVSNSSSSALAQSSSLNSSSLPPSSSNSISSISSSQSLVSSSSSSLSAQNSSQNSSTNFSTNTNSSSAQNSSINVITLSSSSSSQNSSSSSSSLSSSSNSSSLSSLSSSLSSLSSLSQSSNLSSITANNLDIKIVKTPNQAVVVPNSKLIFNIEYSNIGVTPATGVTITELIPAYTTFVSLDSDSRWVCSSVTSGNLCTLTIGNLAPNQIGTVKFVVKINSDVPANQLITNVAGIGDDGNNGDDINTDNNITTTNTPILSESQTAKISGMIYIDTNQNGKQDDNEPNGNLPTGTLVKITNLDNPTQFYLTPIDPNGTYTQIVPPGNYSIMVQAPTNYTISNSIELGDGIGSNATTLSVLIGQIKSAGKDGLYQNVISSSSSYSSSSLVSSSSSSSIKQENTITILTISSSNQISSDSNIQKGSIPPAVEPQKTTKSDEEITIKKSILDDIINGDALPFGGAKGFSTTRTGGKNITNMNYHQTAIVILISLILIIRSVQYVIYIQSKNKKQ
jgi:large repetitive protein